MSNINKENLESISKNMEIFIKKSTNIDKTKLKTIITSYKDNLNKNNEDNFKKITDKITQTHTSFTEIKSLITIFLKDIGELTEEDPKKIADGSPDVFLINLRLLVAVLVLVQRFQN